MDSKAARFVQNKYLRWYMALCESAAQRAPVEAGEKHHILPVSLGGINSGTVRLTYREHFVAHWLLTKFTVGDDQRKMNNALGCMHNGRRSLTARQFDRAKKAVRTAKIGRRRSAETVAKMSAALRGKRISPAHAARLRESAPKTRSPEQRAKISAAHKGKVYSQQTIERMRAAAKKRTGPPGHSGCIHSEETRAKMRAAWIIRKSRAGGAL